jgi:hypothetical protein
MCTLTDRAKSATYQDGTIRIHMESGMECRFPVRSNPRLSKGTSSQLANIRISPFGLHWPDLDEDLSIAGILRGDFGQQ